MTTLDPSRGALEILEGGLLTTIQDVGRPDWTHLGVPVSGPADPWSLAVANLLVSNAPGDAALELTIVGPRLRVLEPVTIGLAGADLGGRTDDGRRLDPGRNHRLAKGAVVSFDGGGTRPSPGARAYLALPGGVDVPLVLGSRSTCLAAGFGGLDGRPLAGGDVVVARGVSRSPDLTWPSDDEAQGERVTLRVLPARDGTALATLTATEWTVGSASDRVGVRLDGPLLPDDVRGEATTQGVTIGAIQVPPNGQPIVLGPDHQTTGGYRVAGVVIAADIPALGQLAPGARVRLETTDTPAAVAALRAQRTALEMAARALREAADWDILAASAGG